MRTILVTGGKGQVAGALTALAPRFGGAGYRLRTVGRPAFDFERPQSIEDCFVDAAPALVVNAAAWTAVDLAESHVAEAISANETGPDQLARLCAAMDVPLIHLSTDYVFDGTKGTPYRETDQANPVCRYGVTKLAGERAVQATGAKTVVLRTSGVYSATGKNFVRTMLSMAQRNRALRVVADQIMCPTSADDLAAAIFAVAVRTADHWGPSDGGIFHAASPDGTSWHEFAQAIFGIASRHGRPAPWVMPIATAEWPTAARRPPDSRLDSKKLEQTYGVRMPDWRNSVDSVVTEICRDDTGVFSA